MKCMFCGKSGVGEPHSCVFLDFGAVGRDPVVWEEIYRKTPKYIKKALADERVRDAFLAQYYAVMTLTWHGADWDITEPYPRITRCIEFDENHVDLLSSPIMPMQLSYGFCNCDCLRKWFLWVVDTLEVSMQSNSRLEHETILNPRASVGVPVQGNLTTDGRR